MISVGHLDLRGSAVAQSLMQPGGVPPVHPPHRGQLHGLDGLPDPLGVDQLGLLEAVDRFGQGIIVGIPNRTD